MTLRAGARTAILSARRFALSQLFASASGFDFSDMDPAKTWGGDAITLMRRDGSGTLLNGNGQSLGVMLDKSANFALGPEQITNGDFASATGWTLDPQWSIGSGVATHASGASPGDLTTTSAAGYAVGDQVRLTLDIVSGSAGGTINTKGPFQDTSNAQNPANGTPYKSWGVAVSAGGAAGGARVTASATFAKSVDNFSLKKMAGFPAQQAASSARPVYIDTGAVKYLLFDGVDDCLVSTLLPAASMTLAACFRTSGTVQLVLGSGTSTGNDRAYLGLGSNGEIAGGLGANGVTVIKGVTDRRNTDVVGLIRWNGTTVELWENGVRVYSGAPNGAANTNQAITVGAENNGGSIGNFTNGRIYGAVAVQQFIPDASVVPLMRQLGALAGLSF